MAFLRKIKAGLVKFPVDQYVGEEGHLFYNEETGALFISDGQSVGGIPITGTGTGPTDTDGLTEGSSNLYYTQARVFADIDQKVTAGFISGLMSDADTLDGFDSTYFATAASVTSLTNTVSNLDTDDIPEGSFNLYYTSARANSAIDTRVNKSFVDALNVDADTLDGFDSTYFAAQTSVDNLTTDDVAEGTNLYYTDPRAVAAVGGEINDSGLGIDDIWSADKIDNYLNEQVGIAGLVGITATSGIDDSDVLIRTDASGYLSASFLAGADTDDISEGSINLYYTQARFDTAISNKDTDDLSEGITNLYYTSARANSAIDTRVDKTFVDALSVDADTLDGLDSTYFATDGDLSNLTQTVSNLTTDDVAEGITNLYYTDERVEAIIANFGFRNVIYVDKSPTGTNEFLTIKDALAEIAARGDAATNNPYVISVGVGRFVEEPFTVPRYVSLTGHGPRTLIQPSEDGVDFITVGADSVITGVSLSGPFEAGTDTIRLDDTLPGELVVSFVEFKGAWGFLGFTNTSSNNIRVRIEDITVSSVSQAVRPFLFETTSTGILDVTVDRVVHNVVNDLIVISHYMEILGPATFVILNSLRISANQADINHLFHIENGSIVILTDAGGADIDTTLHVANVGAAPFVRATGLISRALTNDVLIEHPGTLGSITGALNGDKITIDPASPMIISVFSSQGSEVGLIQVGDIYQGDATSRTVNLTRLIRNSATMGIVSGGEVSYTQGTSEITVAAGIGYAADITDNYVLDVVWAETTLALNDKDERWVTVDVNGTVSAQSSAPANFINTILIARVFADNGEIQFVEDIASRLGHASNVNDKYTREAIGPIYVSGSFVTESASPLQINVSSGTYYYGRTKFTPAGGTDMLFRIANRDGIGGYETTQNAQVVPVKYDNGTGGLANLSTDYYVKHSVYVVDGVQEEKYFLVIGQEEHDNISVAEQANLPLPPGFIKESFALIASIIVQEGNSNIVTILDERPVLGFKATAVSASTTHGNLLGLGGDDHPQYLRTDGTRALTGNMNLGGNSLNNASTYNGVTIQAHASRHLPNGADPLTTGTPLTIGVSNTEGIQNAFARQDHVHSHGDQAGGTLHAVATQSVPGFMSAADKTLLDTIDTDDVAEGTNLYFTAPRAVTAIGGSIDDAGSATDDIWSADKIIAYTNGQVGTSGSVGVQSTAGISDADKLIRTDAAGYLDASFLIGNDTGDLSEGTNLYYTQTRFDTAFGNKSTTDLSEGTNLYFTAPRAVTAIGGSIDDAGSATDDIWSADKIIAYVDEEVGVNGNVGVQATTGISDADKLIRTDSAGYLDASFLIGNDTGDLSEGTNLYYTQGRFDTALGLKTTSNLTEGSNLYYTSARANSAIDTRVDKTFVDALNVDADTLDGFDSTYFAAQTSVDNLTTDDVAEGTNLYYTQTRFDTAFGLKDTGDLSEGTNLYYTQGRFDTAFGLKDTDDLSEGTNLYYTQGRFDTAFGLKDTDDLSEGITNQYFTAPRAVTAVGGSVNDAGVATDDIWSADKIQTVISAIDHGDLLGLTNDDHLQYLRTDGTRALTGNLNLNSNNIITVGTVNGVTVEAHAARHLPSGADPLTTAAAVNTSSSANSQGSANSLARSDHTHQLTSNTPATGQFMQWNGSNWVAAFNLTSNFTAYQEAETLQSTTSATYVEVLTLTTTIPSTGDYEVHWSMEGRNTSKDDDIQLRVQMDNTTTLMEIVHGRENDKTPDDFRMLSGFRRYNIAAGSHTFDVDLRAVSNTAQVRRIRLHVKKVM